MPKLLTPEELERFAVGETLPASDFLALLEAAGPFPDTWTITSAFSALSGEGMTSAAAYALRHRPTGRAYTFTYALDVKTWVRAGAPDPA